MRHFAEFLGNHLCWHRHINWNLIRKPSTLNTKRTIARQLQCNDIIDCSQNGLFSLKVNILGGTIPGSIYIFKVKNRSTRRRCKVSCKLTIKTPARRQWLWTSKCLLGCYDMWRGFMFVSTKFNETIDIFLLDCFTQYFNVIKKVKLGKYRIFYDTWIPKLIRHFRPKLVHQNELYTNVHQSIEH